MSSNYGVLGLAMAAAGVLTDRYGARDVWLAAGCIYLAGAAVSLVFTRWLPVITGEQDEVIDAYANAAATALESGDAPTDRDLRSEPEPGSANRRSSRRPFSSPRATARRSTGSSGSRRCSRRSSTVATPKRAADSLRKTGVRRATAIPVARRSPKTAAWPPSARPCVQSRSGVRRVSPA